MVTAKWVGNFWCTMISWNFYYQMRKIITIQKEPAIKLHPALQRYPMVPWGSEYACLSKDLLPLLEKWMKKLIFSEEQILFKLNLIWCPNPLLLSQSSDSMLVTAQNSSAWHIIWGIRYSCIYTQSEGHHAGGKLQGRDVRSLLKQMHNLLFITDLFIATAVPSLYFKIITYALFVWTMKG